MDPRIKPMAYLTDGKSLFEVTDIGEVPSGKRTVTAENCSTGLRRLFTESEAERLEVVREAPSACPPYASAA